MEKKLADLDFTNRLYREAPFIFISAKTEPLINPKIIHINTDLLTRLELDRKIIDNPSFLRFLNGNLDFEGPFFGASFYSGHQFGLYVSQLGDGRALMLGEIKTSNNDFFEIQYKGSGLTPFSRMGDGKAVVRSSIREYLASAHLKALKIPTTEALSIIKGDDEVVRETIEKSSMILRVAESFLRFGHFEYFAHTNKKEEVRALLEFVIEHYFTHFADHPNRHLLFLQEITKRTAKLFASWHSVGFCHGVLNTDNMSILGMTLDYGPFGFIDNFDLDYVCNHSDHEGRYSLGNQPSIGLWNLERLAEALGDIISDTVKNRVLETYPEIFHVEYRRLMLSKCGLFISKAEDENLIRKLLDTLIITKIDYTVFFRSLSHYQNGSGHLVNIESSNELTIWLLQYDERLKNENLSQAQRHTEMLSINPKFILRNYLAQMVIEDQSLMPKLFDVLTQPFLEWSEVDEWSKTTPEYYKNLSVSCSS